MKVLRSRIWANFGVFFGVLAGFFFSRGAILPPPPIRFRLPRFVFSAAAFSAAAFSAVFALIVHFRFVHFRFFGSVSAVLPLLSACGSRGRL
jgi:hypothetical protein